MTAPDAPLTASDWTSTPLADVVIGADYAYRETIYPSDSVFASPRQTPRRVTAVEVVDGWLTVIAQEPIHVLHNLSPTGEPQHSAKVGDAVMLRTIGPRWDSEFGKKVDAARARSKARREALARVQREIPDGGDLWKVDVALEPLLAVLDERAEMERERDALILENERLQGCVLDAHHREELERERANRAEANAQVAGWSA